LVFQFKSTELEAAGRSLWFDLELDILVVRSGRLVVLELGKTSNQQILVSVSVFDQRGAQFDLEHPLLPVASPRLVTLGVQSPGLVQCGFDLFSTERLQAGIPTGAALFDLGLHCSDLELANGGPQRFLIKSLNSPQVKRRSDLADQISECEKTTKGHKQSADKEKCFVVNEFSNFIKGHE
jgi:hypothetical protein